MGKIKKTGLPVKGKPVGILKNTIWLHL